jgi:hypothetical protein
MIAVDYLKSQVLIQEAFNLYGKFPVFFLNEKPTASTEQYYTTEIGTPVWDRIKFKQSADADNLNYTDRAGVLTIMPSVTLPDVVLVEATQRKNMIKTKMAGANGSVNEEISLDNVQIVIRGVIINYKNDDYPKNKVKELLGAFRRPLECYVESKYLNNVLKVYNLLIEDINLKPMAGLQNSQSFEITCSSDIPLVFDLSKK